MLRKQGEPATWHGPQQRGDAGWIYQPSSAGATMPTAMPTEDPAEQLSEQPSR